jgi:hypothetical protein
MFARTRRESFLLFVRTNTQGKFLTNFFQKVCGVEGAQPSSSPAGDEINLGVSFLQSFFLCAYAVKEKSDQSHPSGNGLLLI